MKIFLISNMYPNEKYPGYGSFVRNVEVGLKKQGFSFPYKALIFGKGENKFHKLGKYIKFYFNILKNYFRKYDFIYIHFPNHALPILLPLYKIKRRPVIINLHGEDLLYDDRGFRKYLGRMNDYFMTRVDGIVVPSEYFKRLVVEKGIPADKIFVSPSGGIDPDFFHPINSPVNHESMPILGYVGRIEDGKGWKEFIDLFYVINEKGLNCKGIIIGNGNQTNLLQNYLKDDRLNNIEHVDHVQQSDLAKYYSKFSLLIFNSQKRESLGLVGIEAMSCGVPVMSGNKYGVSSYLVDGYNGFFIENGDTDKAIETIKRYIDMTDEEKKIYQTNCINTAQRYCRDTVISHLADFFRTTYSKK